MGKKNNIIQFLPYFPPHRGGLETVAEELSFYYNQEGYGEVINIVFDVGQIEKKIYHGRGYTVYLLPSFDLIPNFPVPKIWKKEFWGVIKEIKTIINSSKIIAGSTLEDPHKCTWIIQTHTRFFLSSLLGGLFAKKYKLKWIHIEHGSDYVKLSSVFKSKISYLYDRSIGKWIFKNADILIAISEACKKFIANEFIDRKIELIYRGLEIDISKSIANEDLHLKFPGKIIIGFVGRILKWKNVDNLIRAQYKLDINLAKGIQIVIIGDGEELQNLQKLDVNNQIYFTGTQDFKNALLLQNQFDIHFHTSSPGGGLATTLLQAMYLGCIIIATPYEGANEVIVNGKNGILLENDSVEEFIKGIENAVNTLEKKEEWSKVNMEIIENKFTWKKNIAQYYELLKTL